MYAQTAGRLLMLDPDATGIELGGPDIGKESGMRRRCFDGRFNKQILPIYTRSRDRKFHKHFAQVPLMFIVNASLSLCPSGVYGMQNR